MSNAVYLKIMKRGFNYSQDGSGNRLIYHLQGCNMKCPWCSNPEGIALNGFILADGKPSGAAIPLQTLLDEAESARPLYFDGGGVTLTGGEPTLQFEEIKQFLSLLKERGINTAIETNATSKRLPELFPFLDELIMDFKHYDDRTHRRFTGVSNETVIENMKNASAGRQNTLIRTPLIKGFNADANDAEGFLRVYNTFDTKNMMFELLAYHEYGKKKWENLGLGYEVENGFVDAGTIERFEERYAVEGLKTVRT